MDIQNKVLYHQPRVHMSYIKPQETFIRSLFVLQDSFKEAIRRVMSFLRKTKKLVVMHVRKDDFDFILNPLFIYVDHFYIDWLKKYFDPQFMVLYVCGQYDGKLKSRLSAYSPFYLHNVLREFPDLDELHKHVDIIIDHGLMRAADVVLSCNSSFSFTACMLSDNKQAKFFRQDFGDKRLNEYDPGWSCHMKRSQWV